MATRALRDTAVQQLPTRKQDRMAGRNWCLGTPLKYPPQILLPAAGSVASADFCGARAHHHLHRASREVFRLRPRRPLGLLVGLHQAQVLPLPRGQPVGDRATDGDGLAPIERQPLRHLLPEEKGRFKNSACVNEAGGACGVHG